MPLGGGTFRACRVGLALIFVSIVIDPTGDPRRATFIDALRSAHAARRGVTPLVEAAARAYARAKRESGAAIGETLVDVKDLVRAHTGYDEPIFTSKVIGWVVAGFYEGTSRSRASDS